MWMAKEFAGRSPRVLLLIPHLGGGGAEQVVRLLARELSRDQYELHLALVTQSAEPQNDLPASVTLHCLGCRRVRSATFKLLRLVRELKPAVVFSGMAHLNFLVLILRPYFPKGTRVLIRQNGTVSSSLAAGALPPYTRSLYRLLYRRADRVICQSNAMADDLVQSTGTLAERVAVLPNPLDLQAIRTAASGPVQWSGPGPHLLAVGRLSHEKGFDLLISAFPAVRHQFPAADLVIAGSGPEEARLKAQTVTLGLDPAVRFTGYVNSPYAYFPGATLFVLPSRHEGMPNALLEAAEAGLPIVATPASGGIVDFLNKRPRSWLVPQITASALACCLVTALRELARQQPFPAHNASLCDSASPTPPAFSTSTP